jgi:2-dehydro-3-deoxyphosphogluconate aldolase/(4S)-4-hydroxy-2-oxoglutarate aldolase
MADALERLRQIRLAPVIVIDDPLNAAPLAEALAEGGLPCAEVTFRTAAAAESLRRMADARPDMLLGAGTVLNPRQAGEARAAGAQFIVSPGLNPVVVDYCLEQGIPVFPGVCTPTEIEAGLQRGLKVLKFFPAEPAGGLAYLKAISAPYSMVEFIPTGGINAEKLPAYLAFRSVVACGGSWMAPAEWIRAGDFERIRQETARAVQSIQQITGGSQS